MLTPSRKQIIDYYVILVLVLSWLRFFAYFLIIQSISKLLMTLLRMVQDTVSFLFIGVCYLMIAASVFTIFFAGIEDELFGSLTLSMRTLFDTALANYEGDQELDKKEELYVWLNMLHLVIANIFLLNYLIAILSTVYEQMAEKGDFEYKSNKYQFIEKYSLTFLDPCGYAELVMHPPPISYITIFLAPFAFRRDLMKDASEFFAKVVFWAENVVFIVGFFCIELCQIPLIFFKVIFNLAKAAGFFNFLRILLIWTILGVPSLLAAAFKDTYQFVKLLVDYGDGMQEI